MRRTRSRLALLGILALALSVTAGLTASEASAAKKKKSKAGGIVDITKVVAAPIPDGTATTDGALISTIDVGGNKFKGTQIRDVNAAIQLTGTTGTNPLIDLTAKLTAPNGATTWLFGPGTLGGLLAGPLTLDDESPNQIAPFPGTPRDATQLGRPYQGTAQPDCFNIFGSCNFSPMDNGGAPGTWTLRVYDTVIAGTSVLNSWRIIVVAGKAFKTK